MIGDRVWAGGPVLPHVVPWRAAQAWAKHGQPGRRRKPTTSGGTVTPVAALDRPAYTARMIDRIARIVGGGNMLAGIILIAFPPGASPALLFLRFIAPLPIWGVAHIVVGGLLLAGVYVAANLAGVALWACVAGGAVIGLLNGTTSSPAASMLFTVLTGQVCALHINGLLYRRRLARSG